MPGPVVLVTGASEGGIGYSLCEAFASHGCRVFASARRLSAIESLPANVEKIQLDVESQASCQEAVSTILSKAGRIDILVNNAGKGATGALLDYDIDEAKACFEVNLFSAMRLTQLVVPHMAKNKKGLVINVGSIVGNIPTPWAGVYAASKAAMHAWTEVLRMEVKGLGVNVMLVAPGAITSKFGKKQADSFKEQKEDSLYTTVAKRIEERATMSQRSDHSMPSATLAKGIVSRALKRNPAVYYSAGGKAFLFWILERIPRSIVWRLLSRALGADQVGK